MTFLLVVVVVFATSRRVENVWETVMLTAALISEFSGAANTWECQYDSEAEFCMRYCRSFENVREKFRPYKENFGRI